jgi:hypothetical protein
VLHPRLLSKQTKRLLQSLPQHQPSNFELTDEDCETETDTDLHRSYARPRLVITELEDEEDDEVSDYVAARLAQARELAMQAYRTKWG